MDCDTLIIGAGAAGLFCAATAGYRRRRVLVIDHARKPGKKILMAGGGRCNFTNRDVRPCHYVSENPHFCISALKRFPPTAMIELVERHGVEYEERDHGQLFCRHSARDLLDALLTECDYAGVKLRMNTQVEAIEQLEHGFAVRTGSGLLRAEKVVIATGGRSYPNAGATGFGLETARRFGIPVVPVRPALVPLTLPEEMLVHLRPLAGIALPAKVSCRGQEFRENLLFTHRGLSGPVILQISNYWQPGDAIAIDLLPDRNLAAELKQVRQNRPRTALATVLHQWLPRRLLQAMEGLGQLDDIQRQLANCPDRALDQLVSALKSWRIAPSGSEGYRTAEVMAGGVDTRAISSRTFEATAVPGLHFIGEVLDVTGWLGGYNLHWAWASGYCAGHFV